MKVTISPSIANGEILAPPSKSIGHRLLIAAALAGDQASEIKGLAPSEDILATVDCLRALGADISDLLPSCKVIGSMLTSPSSLKPRILNCRESGSTLRFLLPLALLDGKRTVFKGSGRLMERPMSVYAELCAKNGIFFEQKNGEITVEGKLSSGTFNVAGNISSQFISGLLFALPILSGDSLISINTPPESRPYIDLTTDTLKKFGICSEWLDDRTIHVCGNQKYTATSATVEGDYSNAAFFSAFNFLGGNVAIKGLAADSLQGDKAFIAHFQALNDGFCNIDISHCPDLAPILMVFASLKHGAVLSGTSRLRIKESDRGVVMADELSAFGADISVGEDTIKINRSVLHSPNRMLSSHNDHRIAMSLSVLCSVTGGCIDGCEAVSKSMPDFFDVLESVGIILKKHL